MEERCVRDMDEYVRSVRSRIRDKYSGNDWRPHDIILDGLSVHNHKDLSAHECAIMLRTLSMHAGMLWQKAAGGMPGVTDLGCRHKSGLDLETETAVIEMKNSMVTDNADSRKEKFRKLAAYAAATGKRPIYGIINDRKQYPDGRAYKIRFQQDAHVMEIDVMTGRVFLDHLFGSHLQSVMKYIRDRIGEIEASMCEAFQKDKIET